MFHRLKFQAGVRLETFRWKVAEHTCLPQKLSLALVLSNPLGFGKRMLSCSYALKIEVTTPMMQHTLAISSWDSTCAQNRSNIKTYKSQNDDFCQSIDAVKCQIAQTMWLCHRRLSKHWASALPTKGSFQILSGSFQVWTAQLANMARDAIDSSVGNWSIWMCPNQLPLEWHFIISQRIQIKKDLQDHSERGHSGTFTSFTLFQHEMGPPATQPGEGLDVFGPK